MHPNRFTVNGSYGELTVCADTGLVLDRPYRSWEHGGFLGSGWGVYHDECPDSWEDARAAFGNAMSAYDDIAKFDVEEWTRAWAGEALDGASVDILDIGFWTHGGEYIEPEHDWRAQALLETSGE